MGNRRLREDPISKVDNLCGQSSAKVAPFHGGEKTLRSSPFKDSARRMNGFWFGTTERMLGRFKMAPRLRPCDSGSPRNRPPRPEFWPPADHRDCRARVAAAAGKDPRIPELWSFTMDSHEETCGEELCGRDQRARRSKPSTMKWELEPLLANFASSQVMGHL